MKNLFQKAMKNTFVRSAFLCSAALIFSSCTVKHVEHNHSGFVHRPTDLGQEVKDTLQGKRVGNTPKVTINNYTYNPDTGEYTLNSKKVIYPGKKAPKDIFGNPIPLPDRVDNIIIEESWLKQHGYDPNAPVLRHRGRRPLYYSFPR